MYLRGYQGKHPVHIIYRITYNVYRLNKLANLKLFQGLLRVIISPDYLVAKQDSIFLNCILFEWFQGKSPEYLIGTTR